MKKNIWKIGVVGILGLWLAGSIISLCYSLPWYDEVHFADITHSLITTNKLTLNMLLHPVNVSAYGPVYFHTQKIIISFFGFGIWQFRLLNFTSGIVLLFIFFAIARKLNISKLNICILISLIAFDSRFLFNMISGRMDLFALTLFMTGWSMYREPDKRTYPYIIIAGAISSLAFLATPRIGFYFLVYVLSFILEFTATSNRKKIVNEYILFSLSILLPVLIWIFYSFGSLPDYIKIIFNNPDIANHFGGSIFPVKYQVPLIILWFISGIYVFKTKGNRLSTLLIALFSLPLFHLLFIKEVGPYSAMVMPFIYLGIMIGVDRIPVRRFSVLPGVVAIYMFLGFLSSTFSNIASLEFSNQDSFRYFFKDLRINNSNVLADFPYYYFLTENKYKFISFYNTRNELTENDLDENNIDIALMTKENFRKNSDLFKNLGFKVIAEYSSKSGESLFYRIAVYLKRNIRTGYDGYLLKR